MQSEAGVSGERPLPTRPIVFYDGACGMCSASVDLLLRADQRNTFLFAPLQGETARQLLPALPADASRWSLVYWDEHGIREQSDAVLAVCARLGGPWTIVGLGRFLPRRLRDAVYRGIALNRYRFGRRDICRIPTEAERGRFLP